MTLPLDISPFFSGASLTYTATGLPAGLSIAPASGMISGTPSQVETQAVTVTAANAVGSAQQSFTWTISAQAGVPGQVTGLLAVPGDTEVSLSWQAPAANGAAISDYAIERAIDGGPFTVLADGPGAVAAFTDTGLANGVPVSYRVAAINAEGAGPVSAPAGAVPQAPGSALAVLAFAHGESGGINQAVSTFPGLATAPGTVLIAVTHRGSANDNQVISVSLGGQAATLVGRQYVSGQTKQEQSVWHAPVSGSAADLVVTTAEVTSRVGAALWSVGTVNTGAISFAAATGSGVSALSQTLDAAAGGLVLAHATAIGGAPAFGWTGLDAALQAEVSPSYWQAGAARAFATAVPGHAVTAGFGASFNNTILTVIGLAP